MTVFETEVHVQRDPILLSEDEIQGLRDLLIFLHDDAHHLVPLTLKVTVVLRGQERVPDEATVSTRVVRGLVEIETGIEMVKSLPENADGLQADLPRERKNHLLYVSKAGKITSVLDLPVGVRAEVGVGAGVGVRNERRAKAEVDRGKEMHLRLRFKRKKFTLRGERKKDPNEGV